MNLITMKWAEWDKTQSSTRELLGLFMCALHCAHNIAQNRPDNFPFTVQTIIIATIMSIWGKEEQQKHIKKYHVLADWQVGLDFNSSLNAT